ncbi:SCP2 sterol-binding domain-containing protein [Parasphingorhabdus sp.]|uniref:SCP2 sterol-binding domain-containing protein n=1 Tax=Parasphingorhabdus sp. TaxID=2709688 RepID=UPI003D27EB26
MKTLNEYTKGFMTALATGDILPTSARMDIDNVGSIHIDERSVTNNVDPANCIMRTSHEIYDDLFNGTGEPALAFAKGDLEVNGDMAVALAMPDLFKRANEAA